MLPRLLLHKQITNKACKKPLNYGEVTLPKHLICSSVFLTQNIVSSFGEKNEDKLRAQLKKAQDLINDATAISKNNPEILVLQALLHTAWVAYDGATYGMTLSGKVVELYTKAEMIAPENPRVVYCKAEWGMGSARYFGQDIKPFCKDLERALELFANFKAETPFSPNWGKERAAMLLESCK